MRQILQIVFFCVSLCNMLVLAWAYKSIQEVPSSAPKVPLGVLSLGMQTCCDNSLQFRATFPLGFCKRDSMTSTPG